MMVSYTGAATYVQIAQDETPVARTVSLSDLVMVDLDQSGAVVGVDFAVAPHQISDAMLERLAAAFPEPFKHLSGDRSWLLTHA